MRLSTARLALAAAGLAVVGLVGGAQAAKTAPGAAPTVLTINDATGDAQGGQASTDLTKVVYTTSGTTKKVGKKRVYTPTALVVTMTVAAPVSTAPVVIYEADSAIPDCGKLFLYYVPGDQFRAVQPASGAQVGCGGTDDGTLFLENTPVVAGSTITWTVPLADLAPALKKARSLSEFHTYTGLADPVLGLLGPEYVGESRADADVADSAETFKF